MTTKQIADRLIELCRTNDNMQAVEELYADDIVSIEPCEGPGMPKVQKGKDAIRAKTKWWFDNHTVHSGIVEGPIVAEGYFAVVFKYDITIKKTNQRMKMEEIAVYELKDGKIAQEQFFYSMG